MGLVRIQARKATQNTGARKAVKLGPYYKQEHHSGGDYADCVTQGSPNSIIIEKGSDKGLSLQRETGNEAWLWRGCGAVAAWW